MRYSIVLALAATASAYTTKDAKSNIVPGAYIVQFVEGQDSTDNFYKNLSSNGIEAVKRQTFQTNVFPGTSFRLMADKKSDLDLIGNFTQVHAVTPVRLFSHDAVLPEKRWKSIDLEKLQQNKQKRALEDTFTTHVMTGVDKLHKEGLNGQGIVIAEVDTGIDYTLAALGGGFGPGYKVAFGYDFVGDAYTGSEIPVPDDDPMDCGGHGTHVAGIIAASNDPYVLGVAPNVTLGAYKVFGCTGQVSNDILIQAFTAAFNKGVDLITASIGGASGWPEEPWSAATANIVAMGTPCMLAAGNDGSEGLYYASTASAGTDVTSVGSVDNTNTPQLLASANYIVDAASTAFGYTPAVGSFASVSLPLATDSFDITNPADFCTPVTVDLTGKIALIRRGTCTFAVKAQNAVDAGAKYIMFYNNAPGTLSPSLPGVPVTAAGMVDTVTGEKWIGLLAAGEEVILTFPATETQYIVSPGAVNTLNGGKMSIFSTWNPSNENTIKPVVSAPGGNILSTYPAAEGGYAVLSGTSMATPFTAGVVALYFQAKGKGIKPKVINAALSGTATPLTFSTGTVSSPFLTSVAQQGGGLINAYAVIHGNLLVSEANIAFNDTAHHISNPAFTIKNSGKSRQTYKLTHAPAANVYAFDGTSSLVAPFPPPLDTKYAKVSISSSSLSLGPGESARVTISAVPDKSLDSSLVPFYSGFINITGGGDVITLPYGGVDTDMNKIKILASDGPWPYFDSEFALNGTETSFKPSVGSYPAVLYNLRWATAIIRADVVALKGSNPIRAGGLSIAGSVPTYPQLWNPRGTAETLYAVEWNGALAGGAKVKTGDYKIVLRLLKVFGNPNQANGYESYETKPFFMDMS